MMYNQLICGLCLQSDLERCIEGDILLCFQGAVAKALTNIKVAFKKLCSFREEMLTALAFGIYHT